MIHHLAETPAASFHRVFTLTHLEKSLHHIFLEIWTSMLCLLKEFYYLRVLFLPGNARKHRKSLDTVIGELIIVRMSVFSAGPAGIEARSHFSHCSTKHLSIGIIAQSIGH